MHTQVSKVLKTTVASGIKPASAFSSKKFAKFDFEDALQLKDRLTEDETIIM